MSKIFRLSAFLLTMFVGAAFAQTAEYANNTTFSNNANCLDCTVLNPFNAVDGDLESFSELGISLATLGGEVEQKLIFPSIGAIGDSVVIGVQIPDAQQNISLAQNVFIETFLGAQSNNDRVRIIQQNIDVVQAADNNYLIIFRPVAAYDRISIALSSENLGLTQRFRVKYAARFSGLGAPVGGGCEKAVTQSVNATQSCIGCEVANPTLSVDASELTFAEFVLPSGLVGAFIEQNLQFATTGLPGDTVEIVMEIPNRSLDVNTLGGISVASAMNGAPNGDRQTVANAGLNVVALTGNKFAVRFVPQDPFNIINVRVETGLLGANETLYLYYACLTAAGTGNGGSCNPATLESNESSDLCIGCSVQNSNNAVDGDLNTASQLTMPAALAEGFVSQTLIFPTINNADDEVTLFLALDTLLDFNLLGSVTVETELQTISNNDASVMFGNNVTAAGGGNRFEYRFRPSSAFDRVKVTINSQLLGATSLFIFEGCVTNLEPVVPGPGTCDNGNNTTTDQTNCSLCDVFNPANVIDEDPSSFSLLQIQLAESGSVSQTVYFGKTACTGDTVNIVIEDDNGLLGANIFGSVRFVTVKGSLETFSTTIQAGSLVLDAGNRYIYTFPIPSGVELDAVKLELNGGLLGFSRGVRWYSACLKTLPPPKVGSPVIDICYNTSVTLTANTSEAAVITWYDAPTGGNLLFEGSAYTVGPLTDTTIYYLEARRPNASCVSPLRSSYTVNVKPEVPAAVFNQNIEACFGESVDIVPEPFGGNFNFYGDAAGRNLLFTGSFLRINPVNSDSTVYVQLIVDDCPSEVLVPASIKMKAITPAPALADSIVICIGGDVALPIENASPSATYNWYDAAFGGNRLFTGDTLFMSDVVADTSFFVEAVDTPCGVALSRTFVRILVVEEPTVTLSTNTVFVCPGDEATLVASPSVPQAVVLWYDTITGGTPLAEGNTYNFTPTDTVVEVYVGVKYDQCEQTERQLVRVFNQQLIIDGLAYDTTICAGSGVVLQVNPQNPNSTVTWWTNATGGTQLASTPVFEVASVPSTTIFYAQIDITGCNSFDRVPVTVNTVETLNLSLEEDTIYFCSSDFNTGNVTFEVNNVFPGTNVSWYDSQIGGLKLADSTNTYTLGGAIRDTFIVYFEGVFGGCTSGGRQAAVAIFSEIVGKAMVRDTMICEGQSVTLTAISSIPGAIIRWWDAATGGNLLAIANSFNTPTLTADVTYYVDIDLGTYCEFISRTPVTVDVMSQLTTPIPTCSQEAGETTTEKVTFTWAVVPGAIRYEVSIDGGATWQNANGNKFVVDGLAPGSSVAISVRAIGIVDCVQSLASAPVTCRANECPVFDFTLEGPSDICVGDQFVMDIVGLNGLPFNYEVFVNGVSQGSATTFTKVLNTTGENNFSVSVTDTDNPGCGSPKSKQFTVVVRELPTVNFTADYVGLVTPGNPLNEIQFMDESTIADQWFWEFGDGGTSTEKNPLHTYAVDNSSQGMTYDVTLTVTSEFGCVNSKTFFDAVRIYTVENIFIPTGFCPSCGDDPFRPHGEGLELVSFKIFNQWGNIVHDVQNGNLTSAGWDGTYNGQDQPVGTYVYTAVLVVSSTNEQVIKQGTVTLIR